MSRSVSGESAMMPWGSGGERRCSLLSEGFARSEHTVVNVGGEEGGLRLVCSILLCSSSLPLSSGDVCSPFDCYHTSPFSYHIMKSFVAH